MNAPQIFSQVTESFKIFNELTNKELKIGVDGGENYFEKVLNNDSIPDDVELHFGKIQFIFEWLKSEENYEMNLMSGQLELKMDLKMGQRIFSKRASIMLNKVEKINEKNEKAQMDLNLKKLFAQTQKHYSNLKNEVRIQGRKLDEVTLKIGEICGMLLEDKGQEHQKKGRFKSSEENEKDILRENGTPTHSQRSEYSRTNDECQKKRGQSSRKISGLDEKGNGFGNQVHPNGDVYEGQFKRFLYDGKGKYTHSNGDRYEGDFKKGLREGKGKFFYVHGDYYDGQFKENLIQGKGIYHYQDGDWYEGEFKNEKKHGEGIYYFASGQRFEGFFRNDCEHGRGEIHFPNGTYQVEVWDKGRKKN